MWVKICGVRRKEDVDACLNAGADAAGFLVGQVHASDDFITVEEAKQLIDPLPMGLMPLVVTHLDRPADLIDIVKRTGAMGLQLHSEIRPADVAVIRKALPRVRILKSLHVEDIHSLVYAEPYLSSVDGFVLDTLDRPTGRVGGTGKTHDWDLSAEIVRRYKVPMLLAGGLTPENVARAIHLVKPYGVDVNSGVKGPDGYKDPKRIQRFVQAAKGA